MEVASLGTLSKLYANMNDSAAKKAVSRSFNIPKFEYMCTWLRCMTVIRNICAHHARLWNTNIVVYPCLPKRMPNTWIDNRLVAPDKLYPHLCYIAYWLRADPGKRPLSGSATGQDFAFSESARVADMQFVEHGNHIEYLGIGR